MPITAQPNRTVAVIHDAEQMISVSAIFDGHDQVISATVHRHDADRNETPPPAPKRAVKPPRPCWLRPHILNAIRKGSPKVAEAIEEDIFDGDHEIAEKRYLELVTAGALALDQTAR